MSLNLAEVQQNVDRLLTTCASMAGAYQDAFFSPTAGDVEIQVYDDEGHLTTVTIPNRAKIIEDFQATVIGGTQTIHVTPSGDDSTGDGSEAAPFGSVHAALASLNGKRLLAGAFVLIQLAEGVYGADTPLQSINPTHPDIGAIRIQGNVDDAIPFSMSAAPNTSARTFTVDSQSGFYSAVDFAPGGNYRDFMIAVAGSTQNNRVYTVAEAEDSGSDIVLTVNEPIYSDVQDGTIYLMPANRVQLIFAEDQHGIVRRTPGALTFRGGSLIGQSASANNSGFQAHGAGAFLQTSHLICRDFNIQVIAEDNATVEAWATGYQNTVWASGGIEGFAVSNGGNILISHACAAGASIAGFFASIGGSITAHAAIAADCVNGYFASDEAVVRALNAFSMNNATGCWAFDGGTIDRDGLTNAGNDVNYNPEGEPPVESSNGGLIV